MSIQFLRVTPEEALQRLEVCANKGYATKLVIQHQYDKAGHGNITDEFISDVLNRVNGWSLETKNELLEIYFSPNYMYNFLETEPNLISTAEESRFYDTKASLLQKVNKLMGYIDFIIQHSNPTLSLQNNVTYMHLNPERDLNVAGRDVNTEE